MNTRTFKTYIEVNVEVTYSFTKGRKGTRDKFGVPEAPDERRRDRANLCPRRRHRGHARASKALTQLA